MLFRLINILIILYIILNKVLYKYLNKFCIVYINNILIYLKEELKHKRHIKKVFIVLEEARLKVKLKKLEFSKKEV